MAKVTNIVLHTLQVTRDSVDSQLKQMQSEAANLNERLNECLNIADQCLADLAIIDMSIDKLCEPIVKVSKKKDK